MNEIEEIKQRVDIVDLVGGYVALKKTGTNYKGVCPFHQEKTPSLMVSPQKQIWKCFGCGKGGSVFDFVMEAESLEFGDALKLLAQKAGVELKSRTTAEHQTQGRKELLYRINSLAMRIFQKVLWETPEGTKARDYLKSRQLTDETIKKFGLGYASRRVSLAKAMSQKSVTSADLARVGAPEKFFERIMFPIFDVLGNVIAFTGRAMGDVQPKYLNSPETPLFNKSRILYGLNFAKSAIKAKDRVLLVEGQMDVIALSQAGAEEAVASSGTAVTESQLLTLSKYTPNFFLGFDGDTAGVTTTKKVIELLLKNDLNGRVVDFAPHKDAGELLEKEPSLLAARLKGAKEMLDWLIDQVIAEIGSVAQIEQKKKAVQLLLPSLKLVLDPTRLDYYVGQLSARLQLSAESLYESLKRLKSQGAPASATPRSIPSQSKSAQLAKGSLTNEEQLLAILLYYPQLGRRYRQQLSEVVWQSADAETIADAALKCYDDETLVKNQSQLASKVKTALDSQPAEKISSSESNFSLGEKIDSWQFWLSGQWEDFSPALAEELVAEKFGQVATKQREQQKSQLAAKIKQAQAAGDLEAIKTLISELTKLTKE